MGGKVTIITGATSGIGEAAVFLCSPAASGITGHSLPVEGGQLANL